MNIFTQTKDQYKKVTDLIFENFDNRVAITKSKLSSSFPYKIEVMITSLTEMLELPNFGNMTTSTIEFESHDKILLVTS